MSLCLDELLDVPGGVGANVGPDRVMGGHLGLDIGLEPASSSFPPVHQILTVLSFVEALADSWMNTCVVSAGKDSHPKLEMNLK